MSINPISTTNNIREEYTKYLKSMFIFKDNALREEAEKAINENKKHLVKGPYLESTAMYKSGHTLRELIKQGKLHNGFEHLVPYIGEFPLHLHQEKAIEKAVIEDKNMIVATGTGSGKTESFLIPILNYLVKENEEGRLTPGIRAMILYPMNALANDQLKRFRDLLKAYPKITFGRYTGETKEERKEALDFFKKTNPVQKILENELLSRVEMRKEPPHILLTNYAMLEYLLLRPDDNVFFDGQYSDKWKYIVLDEAHVYSGSLGSEISYLIARLKDRVVGGKSNKLKFIATSATLGDGRKGIDDVVKYAKNLFGEEFTPDCLITSERVKTLDTNGLIKPDITWYKELLNLSNKYEGIDLIKRINDKNIYAELSPKANEEILYDILRKDFYLIKLKKAIEKETLLLKDAIVDVFGRKDSISEESFVALVDLAAKAKKENNSEVLLPARYHTFSKAIEGAFVQFYPTKKIYLNRKDYNLINNEKIKIFELSNCIKCGQEYIIGKEENNYLLQSSGFFGDSDARMEYYLLDPEFDGVEVDEDSVIDSDKDNNDIKVNNAEPYLLCIKCGRIQKDNSRAKKDCCHNCSHIRIYKLAYKHTINTCLSCGSHSANIIRRLINADAPTTEMLARTLYQNIADEKEAIGEVEVENFNSPFAPIDIFETEVTADNIYESGRKLLAFSDSRKEAAYFSTYMNTRYNSYLWRKIIYDAICLLDGNTINYNKLHMRIYKDIDGQEDLLSEDENLDEKISAYIMYELLAYEQEIGLEGVGLISFEIEKPSWWPQKFTITGLNSEEVWKVIQQIFNGLRQKRAIDFPDELRQDHYIFENRSKIMKFRFDEANAPLGIMSIVPKGSYNNMRLDYLTKIFIKRNLNKKKAKESALEFLSKTFNDPNLISNFINSGIYKERYEKDEGTVYQLNHKKWIFKKDSKIYQCSKCGKKTTICLEGVCPSYRCDGVLKSLKESLCKEDYYIDVYNNIKKIPMKIKEHTAQLNSLHASEVQGKFEKGEINILSCSTTFEMGVDVGSLETVFLRNIPPETANYVQRAGRAGRRTSSTAYILTYAKRRSHDLYYYQNPTKIIEGQIKVPYIEKHNGKIAFRHISSVVFSWAFRQNKEYFKDVQALFAYNTSYPSIDERIKEMLALKPEEIKTSLKNILNTDLQKEFGIEDWDWIDSKLLNENENLIISKNKWLEDIQDITKIKEENYRVGKSIESISRMLKTFLEKGVIDFLAGNNILPRYGFPIDSVNLDTIHNGEGARNIQLSRDMKMAISEFAPGSQVIANGLIWESHAINRSRTKGWPTYLYGICKECKNIYKEPCDYDLNLKEDIDDSKKICSSCGNTINLNKFIKPIFGFSTNNSEPKKPTLSNPNSTYSSKVYFHQYDENNQNYKDKVFYNDFLITYTYSPRGNLFIVNSGRQDMGFKVCSWCGFATYQHITKEFIHKDKYGNRCGNKYLKRLNLGHEIITDIIEIEIPNMSQFTNEAFYLSVLYALIEGAAGYLGIDRREIDGCLNYTTVIGNPSFIIYDQVPGGAGHVKRIGKKIDMVIKEAKQRVMGLCGCSEETSCYGCLRNYFNQINHDILQRGYALEFFEMLDRFKVVANEVAIGEE